MSVQRRSVFASQNRKAVRSKNVVIVSRRLGPASIKACAREIA
jgi:hypothetical protein